MVRFYLGLCVVVFILTALGGGEFRLFASPLLSESLRWGAIHPTIVIDEPWRLLSAMFVHFGVLHLFMNMSALISLGAVIERTFGSARFVITFVGTGIFGFVVSAVWSLWGPGDLAPTAGASGGLFGLACFEIGFLYRARDPRWKQALMRMVIAAVIIGLLFSANNAAHAGGGLAGMVVGYLSYRERSWRRYDRFWRLLSILLVAGSLASIALSAFSDTWRVMRAVEIQRGIVD